MYCPLVTALETLHLRNNCVFLTYMVYIHKRDYCSNYHMVLQHDTESYWRMLVFFQRLNLSSDILIKVKILFKATLQAKMKLSQFRKNSLHKKIDISPIIVTFLDNFGKEIP